MRLLLRNTPKNKTVYAFPGNAQDKVFEGNNNLIKNGAKLILGADDIVKDYEKDGSLNPFNLEEVRECNMEEALNAYAVSALWQGDEVFSPKSRKKAENKTSVNNIDPDFIPKGLKNKKMIELYKKIPPSSDGCPVDFLVEGEFDLMTVMSTLLKLEVEGAVEMLVGDRVRRRQN